MHFLSTVPTLLLAALTFSGTSLQTPVEGLEHRQLPPPPSLPPGVEVELGILRAIALSFGDAAGVAAGGVSSIPPFFSIPEPTVFIALEHGANER